MYLFRIADDVYLSVGSSVYVCDVYVTKQSGTRGRWLVNGQGIRFPIEPDGANKIQKHLILWCMCAAPVVSVTLKLNTTTHSHEAYIACCRYYNNKKYY